jgi:undecaprenyl-diphosphatase
MAGSFPSEAIRPGDLMESLNQTFFLWLNAPEHPVLALTLATFFAEQLIWAVPLLIGIGWLRGGEPPARRCSLLAHRDCWACSSTRSSAWLGCILGLS